MAATDKKTLGFNGNEETPEEEFRQFDMVRHCSDHKFLYNASGGSFDDQNSSFCRTIMKEWKILQENLPESIYVRAFEDRIDLLRAVIIGPKVTPYQDGLFFFDIAFPSNYPDSPPLFFYRSFGCSINPNLYIDGLVCLSILNTWSGSASEIWDPRRSSILQVLVSIQGLVLNEQPYHNEPSYIKPASNWKKYNEIVVQETYKTMVSVLRRPPQNFEDFVASHFRKSANSILKALRSYKAGTSIPGLYQEDKKSDGFNRVSRQFKRTLHDEYLTLLPLFIKIGAPLQNLEPINESIIDKVIRILEKCWCFSGR